MSFDLNTHYLIEKLQNELKRYKDIERELGIDLMNFVKILKSTNIENSVYFKWLNKKEGLVIGSNFFGAFYLDMKEKAFVEIENLKNKLYFKDYGKTWALTKEELL